MAKKQEPEFTPFPITSSHQSSSLIPTNSVQPDSILPATPKGQWEATEMKDRGRADLIEQEIMKLKGLIGEHQLDELNRYVIAKTGAGIDDMVALKNQPRDPEAQAIFEYFLNSQVKGHLDNVKGLQNDVAQQIRTIASRPVHVDKDDEPQKKGILGWLRGE